MFAQADSVWFVFKSCVRVQLVEKHFQFANPFTVAPIVHVSASIAGNTSTSATIYATVKKTDVLGVTILLSFKQAPNAENDVRVKVQYFALAPSNEQDSSCQFVRLNRKLVASSFQVEFGTNEKQADFITKKIPLIHNQVALGKSRIHVLATLHHATQFCIENEEESSHCFTATVLQANSRFVKVIVKRVSASVRYEFNITS